MSDILYFSRDTKVYIEIGSAIWELPVLDGFSFSQATNSTEIQLNEMADSTGASRRGRRVFNDSYAPAEWSLTTYVRPFISAGTGAGAADSAAKHHAVEEALWAMLVGDAAYASSTFTGMTHGLSSLVIDFDDSNKTTLGTCNLYFVLGACSGANTTTYKISSAAVNEATITFDIDGIASIQWSGFGKIISEESTAPTATIYEAINSTSNFIRNRLTSLAITGSGTGNFEDAYNLTLTGGQITISNNMTYLTPETMCVVNQPLGHVTGTRTISGNFTCYLGIDTVDTDRSADLFEDLIESTSIVTNSFGLTFAVGGASAPKMTLTVPQAHLEIPVHSIDDVISVDVAFHALPSTIDETDELTVTYVGAA